MSDSEGPPPLVDSSSDEAEGGCRRYHRDAPPSRSLQGTAVAPCLHSPDSSEPPPPPPDRSDPSPGIRREADHEHEAAEFSLSRMKQSSKLQAWDHNDFVRSLNESLLSPPSLKRLVVFQEAQVDAFMSGGHQLSPLDGWAWRGRKGSGVVNGGWGLGMLQHLRDSRLFPYRLGCNCLYEHPGLMHLLVGRQGSNAPSAFPRLMHVNPTMSGPVYLRREKDSVAPWGVGFAGAEFVVLSKTVVGVEEVWEVVSELVTTPFKPGGDDASATPGIEGLPESHAKNGTARSTAFVPVTLEGKATLVEGQAPIDIDRFKAWHMSPQYHAISHHLWCLEDLRIFIFLHRLALILWSIAYCVRHLTIVRWIGCIILLIVAMQMVEVREAWIYTYYRSRFGTIVMAIIRVFLSLWLVGRSVLKLASAVVRRLVTGVLAIPGIILPREVSVNVNVVGIIAELAQFVVGGGIILYHGSIEAIVARLPPVPVRIVRFVDACIEVLCNIFVFFFAGLAALVFWWYCVQEESPLVQTETRYRALLAQTDAQSKMEFSQLVRKLVFDLRAKIDLAMDRRRRAGTRGALECSGERRGGAHACLAALAVAAIKLERKASTEEKSAITRILVKSGTIRDSLVRTARVVLATDPAKAVAEVAHELMHAAHAGLIWPDEPLIACALQSEGRDPTAENVMWHRSKWVAVAASMIVEIVRGESQPSQRHPWFKRLPGSETKKEFEYRERGIHPAERCVQCFTATHVSSSGTNGLHMKTEGRKPLPRLSACRSVVVEDSRRRRLQPHCEMEEDDCRVTLTASREVFDKPNEFPFFHAKARQPKVGPDRARRLAVRLKSLNDKYEELVRLDRDMADANASPPQPSLAPELRRTPTARGQEENEKRDQDREAARERKERRLKTRRERAIEAEAVRKQRLQKLEEGATAAAASDDEDEDDEDEDDETLCIMCMTEKRNACLVHGRTSHQVTCLSCANKLKEAEMGCPMCKRRIDVVIENFTS